MTFEIAKDGSTLTIALSGKLDAGTAPGLDASLASELPTITDVVFDLEQLTYISSAGLRTLLATYKRVTKVNGTMNVINACEDVMDVLKMSGFAALYGIEEG